MDISDFPPNTKTVVSYRREGDELIQTGVYVRDRLGQLVLLASSPSQATDKRPASSGKNAARKLFSKLTASSL